MTGPKVLFLDIETAPLLGFTWGTYQQNIGLDQIHRDWFILSWAAKWQDSPKVLYQDLRSGITHTQDSRILKGIWNLLDEADIIVTQNGKEFDAKKLNARFIYHGFQPPSPYRHIDTLKLAKKYFAFTSNKLAYLTDKLNTKYKKLTHAEFEGFKLWDECLKGNQKAWREMERYNKQDVLALEELYNKLIPWDSSTNFALYREDGRPQCSCGNLEMLKKGFYYTAQGKFQRYRCTKCGAQTYSGKNLLNNRQNLHKGVNRC